MAVLAEPYDTDRWVVIDGIYTDEVLESGEWAPAVIACHCGLCLSEGVRESQLYDETKTAAFYRTTDGFGRTLPDE
jgi:hypothetical protein